MATNTSRFGFILPDDGGDNEVWDNHLNKNLVDLDVLLGQVVAMHNNQDPIGTVKLLDNGKPLPVGWANCDGRVYGGYKTLDMRNRAAVGVGHRQTQGSKSGSIYWSDESPPTHNQKPPFNGRHGHFTSSDPTAWLMRGDGNPPGDFGYTDGEVSDHIHIQRQQYWGTPGRWIVKYRDLTISDLRSLSV